MVNITHKRNTLRIAVAQATLVVSRPETIQAIENRTVPKGDVFEFSRAAGLLAIKKTSDVIPDCHPLPIEYAHITHRIEDLKIYIQVQVHTIYKTGVEVEAMHGASVTALTMYDMLKPLDKGIEIREIRLISKKGGKTDFTGTYPDNLRTAVIVCSDRVSEGKAIDKSGEMAVQKLEQLGIKNKYFEVVPDELQTIADKAIQLSSEQYDLVLFTGGTGLSSRDVTPDAIEPLLDRPVPGLMEATRNYGQQFTPYAMLSRGVAGFIKNTLVITLPGSVNGVSESMDALFPYLLHVFKVLEGARHD